MRPNRCALPCGAQSAAYSFRRRVHGHREARTISGKDRAFLSGFWEKIVAAQPRTVRFTQDVLPCVEHPIDQLAVPSPISSARSFANNRARYETRELRPARNALAQRRRMLVPPGHVHVVEHLFRLHDFFQCSSLGSALSMQQLRIAKTSPSLLRSLAALTSEPDCGLDLSRDVGQEASG